MARILVCLAALVLTLVSSAGVGAQELAKPVLLKSGEELIDTDIGHAAPYIYDWNRDGLRDLLVGQFGEGKLRIYLNEGSEKRPRYGAFSWFKAGRVEVVLLLPFMFLGHVAYALGLATGGMRAMRKGES